MRGDRQHIGQSLKGNAAIYTFSMNVILSVTEPVYNRKYTAKWVLYYILGPRTYFNSHHHDIE